MVNLDAVNKQAVASNARQAGGLTGLLAAFTGNLPHVTGVSNTAVWVTTVIVSAGLFIAEHYLGDPSTGNPTAPSGGTLS